MCVGVGEALLSGMGAQPVTGAQKALLNFPRLIVLELGARTLVVYVMGHSRTTATSNKYLKGGWGVDDLGD